MNLSRGSIVLLVILAVLLMLGLVQCRDSEQKLTEQMWRGDHKALEKQLRSNPSLANQRFSLGDTPLHLAISYSNPSNIIRLLVTHGADVDAKAGGFGLTPLHKAAWNGNLEAVKALVANGADVNAFNNENNTPLTYAITARSIEIIDFLLKNGAKINHGYPVLFSAESDTQIMLHLLSQGASPNVQDGNGHTPLHRAVMSDRTNLIDQLIGFGANLRVRDHSKETPLATALHWNRFPSFITLLNAALRRTTNTLNSAAALGETQQVREIIAVEPARISQTDDFGFTALHWAAQSEHSESVEGLLSLNADPAAADDIGYTPIAWAAYRGRTQIVELLLKKLPLGSERLINQAFLMAVQQGHTETATVLLRNGADVNAALSMGRTALHIASARGDAETVRLLLDHKAYVNALDRNRSSPLRNSLFSRSAQVIKMLVARGANPEVETFAGGNLFHEWALGAGEHEVADELLALKLDVNAKNAEGRTPLHVAAHQGTTNAVQWLLAHGADANAKDSRGKTALGQLNGRRGIPRRREVAEILRRHGATD